VYRFSTKHETIVKKCKVHVITFNFIHFNNILIDNVISELELCSVLDMNCYECNIFDPTEDGIWGLKRLG
jgi:hypothetical protein